MTEPVDNEALVDKINEITQQWDKLCLERHEAGAAEYGLFTFLGNDVIRMMAEELADTANYCRMQFIKIMLLGEYLAGDLDERGITGAVTIGLTSFKGTGETGWSR